MDEIAFRTGAEPLLVLRLMRVLAAHDIFVESSEETFSHNALSSTLKDPVFRAWIHGHAGGAFIMSKLPEFLESTGWRNPTDLNHALFQFASGGEQDIFSWLHEHPPVMKAFSACMAASTILQGSRLRDIIASILLRNASHDEKQVLCIDIGGGSSKVLGEICQLRPEIRGRMIVQDLPKEIEEREALEKVEGMPYNFFDLQPVQGKCLMPLSSIHRYESPNDGISAMLT